MVAFSWFARFPMLRSSAWSPVCCSLMPPLSRELPWTPPRARIRDHHGPRAPEIRRGDRARGGRPRSREGSVSALRGGGLPAALDERGVGVAAVAAVGHPHVVAETAGTGARMGAVVVVGVVHCSHAVVNTGRPSAMPSRTVR